MSGRRGRRCSHKRCRTKSSLPVRIHWIKLMMLLILLNRVAVTLHHTGEALSMLLLMWKDYGHMSEQEEEEEEEEI